MLIKDNTYRKFWGLFNFGLFVLRFFLPFFYHSYRKKSQHNNNYGHYSSKPYFILKHWRYPFQAFLLY